MAQANTSSSAKPLHRLRVDHVHVTIWDGPRATFEREYVYQGKAGYASSFREEDLDALKKAIDQFAEWAAPEVVPAAESGKSPKADKA